MSDLKIKVNNSFLKAFDHLVIDKSLGQYNKYKLNLFTLKLNANKFNLHIIKEQLGKEIVKFALTEKRYDELFKADDPHRITKEAIERFIDRNNGELGELFLYSFLKNHLKALKILSKIDLKTSVNMHVHGSDGIHILKVGERSYHIIFGEAKVYAELNTAIKDAFESIVNFKDEISNKGTYKSGIEFEKSLISNHVSNEFIEGSTADIIIKALYPSREDNSEYKYEYESDDAFAIFIMYEIDIDIDIALPKEEYQKKLHQNIEADFNPNISEIENIIKDKKLGGHHFYIYILPINNLNKNTKELKNYLTLNK